MRKLILGNEEVDVKDCWEDLSTGEYISLMELYSVSKDLVPEAFLVKFISILIDRDEKFINSLYEDDLVEFIEIINNFKMDEFVEKEQKTFLINDVLYSYNIPNKLTLGEKISIKLLEKNSKSEFEQWLNILCILIRPAKEKTNEFGEIEYELEPFVGDIEILNNRKELLKKIPGVASMSIIKSFTDGRLKS